MKVLITGATGYVGSTIIPLLKNKGHSLTAFVLPSDDVSYIKDYCAVVRGDVRDISSLETAIKGQDLVVHLAGIIDISSKNKKLMHDVNVNGTVNVGKTCLKEKVKMIYCSSVHAIPCLKKGATMCEIRGFDAKKVKGTYSKTKAEATKEILKLVEQGLECMIAFPSGIVGPGEHRLSNIGALISDFLTDKLVAYIQGYYNFVDVRDVSTGILQMVEHYKSGENYILANEVISVEEMIKAIAETSGKPMLKRKLSYGFVLMMAPLTELWYRIRRKKPLYTLYSIKTLRANCNFSIEKARQELGYNPRPVKESLKEMTKWIMEKHSS